MSEFDSLSREELVDMILEQRELITMLHNEVEDLRGKISGGSGNAPATPDWVRPNRKERRAAERKKRKQSFVRKREMPSRRLEHALSTCPDCGRPLTGGTVKRVRQVIEIPTPAVEIVEHRFIARRCGYCGKTYVPKAGLLRQHVVGKHRVGVNLMSMVAYLSTAGRMTKRTIQGFLKAVYGVHLGLGEISKVLHTVADCGKEERGKLLEVARGSPYINADETGWREDGLNGYIWTFSTKDVRYFVYRRSRAGKIAKETIGDDYEGVVVTDCYAGYNQVVADRQVCWAHLARDLHKLKEKNAKDADVIAWTDAVKSVYDRAKRFRSRNPEHRKWQRLLFEEEVQTLVERHACSDSPQQVLAKRFLDHLQELFMFVEYPDVPADNNGAERSLRPCVIARKVSGGTRSERGSETKMTLLSLFGTWQARRLDPLLACRLLLTGKSLLFPS
jgi:transposase